MHDPSVRTAVRELTTRGLSATAVARELSLPRSTVRDMRRPVPSGLVCPRCWLPARPLRFGWSDYAYLLGLYLGDGCIARLARTYSFRLSLDAKYPGIVREARAAMARFSSTGRVSEHRAGSRRTTAVLCVYGNHLPCLFPQHGRGKKHDRRIALEPWQQTVAAQEPWLLLRGLIQSDGCRFVNRTGRYAYPSYDFCQVSTDIQTIFVDVCVQIGLRHRRYERRIRIYDRASVSLIDQHVGPKT